MNLGERVIVSSAISGDQHLASTSIQFTERNGGYWVSTIGRLALGRMRFETLVFNLPLPKEVGMSETADPELAPFNDINNSLRDSLRNHEKAVATAKAVLERQIG